MEYNPGLAILLASGMMTKIALRKKEQKIDEIIAQPMTSTMPAEEIEEMRRAPRAYMRRKLKAISKSNGVKL